MRVAILGCGYVGTELGRQLLDAGADPVGVRRSADAVATVSEAGIRAVRADVTNPTSLDAVPDADALVFLASPGRGGSTSRREVTVGGVRTTVDHFAARSDPPDTLIAASSTGVYADRDGGWVDEATPVDPVDERRRGLVAAERAARQSARDAGLDVTVVRFGGLYGPGRVSPERYLNGDVPARYVNLIHRDDAAGVVQALLDRGRPADPLVAVDDEPVDRRAIARWLAAERGETGEEAAGDEVPTADGREEPVAGKRCSNAKLRSLGYEFRHPSFREGFRAALSRRDGEHS